MKKYLTALLAVLIAAAVAGLCAVRLTAEQTPRFSDLRRSDPYRDYILALVDEGIMSGREDGTFGVKENAGREEVMELLLKIVGVETKSLPEDAVEHRLVYWYEETDLQAPVTRLETARMAARALDLLPMSGESPYRDCDDGYVVKLWEKGVWDCGERFRPEDPLTRGELAQLLWNMKQADVSAGAFRYNGYWVDPLEGVRLNEYDRSQFGWGGTDLEYTGGDYDVIQGVDISRYQNEIDWDRVRDAGIEFVMVRVGGRFMNSGEFYEDRRYRENIEGALEAGLDVGVYFFSQAVSEAEGIEEAEYLLSLIEGYDLTMPVAMDWEALGGSEARTYGVEPKEITAAVRGFCDRVRAAGYEPMIYCNAYSAYTRMDLRELTDIGIWLAQYNDVPTFYYHFDLWQYSDRGMVDGIDGAVDLNLYFRPCG